MTVSALTKSTASRDSREVIRAAASLAGLAIAIAAAVGIGSLLGGGDVDLPGSLQTDSRTTGSVQRGEPGSFDLSGTSSIGSETVTPSGSVKTPAKGGTSGAKRDGTTADPTDPIGPPVSDNPIDNPPPPIPPTSGLTDFIDKTVESVPLVGSLTKDVTSTTSDAIEDVLSLLGL